MVVKINAPTPHCSTTLQYNERKVAEGKASVIFSSNIDDPRNPMKTFEQYENGSLRTEKMSFHASINPSITDNMTDEQVREFARKYMEKIQTPTLTMIVEREEKIRAFKARPYYELHAVFGCQAGSKVGFAALAAKSL